MTKRGFMNVLFVIGAVLLLSSLLARYVIINGFITHPINPLPAFGETIPYEVKGKTVYITPGEEDETTVILIGEITGLMILFVYTVAVISRRT